MKLLSRLLDTHTLLFWSHRDRLTVELQQFLDHQDREGSLGVSAISFLEIGLLIKKSKIKLHNLHRWKEDLLSNCNLTVVSPTIDDMISSTELPDHHKDPFDRLLIAQAQRLDIPIVTRDKHMDKYDVETFWM